MKHILKDAVLLSIVSLVLAFAVNSISSNGIPLEGTWYDNRHRVKLEVPPSYDPETDSLLSMQEAFTLWNDKKAVFLDTREPDEFAEGHIPGAINFPFEQWDDFWDKVEPFLSYDNTIVCYCGGLDCELSLFAAREFQAIGYPKSYVFFGGYDKWVEYDLPWESDYED